MGSSLYLRTDDLFVSFSLSLMFLLVTFIFLFIGYFCCTQTKYSDEIRSIQGGMAVD